MKIAVIGAGIAGLSAAWALARQHEVTLFEAAPRAGGHANTVTLAEEGRQLAIDAGFIVYNERTYPNLVRLFDHLGVTTQASEMSFGVSIGGDFEYASTAPGALGQPRNLLRPRYWKLLRDLARFYADAEKLQGSVDEATTLGKLLESGGYRGPFVEDHLLPMGAAIWSTSAAEMLRFPAKTFLDFCRNHALLAWRDRPQWRSVACGAERYVERLLAGYRGRLRLASPIVAAERRDLGWTLVGDDGARQVFDQLVFACPGPAARRILGDAADPAQRAFLGAFRSARNRALLHSDPALMPRRRACWASWNYLADATGITERKVSVSYWMNRLQRLQTRRPYFVSLNPLREPRPALIHAAFDYEHPLYDAATYAAQRTLPNIQGRQGLWFCGAYLGYGFHEDGLQSGLTVAAALGAPAPWLEEVTPMSSAARWTQPEAAPLHPILEAAE